MSDIEKNLALCALYDFYGELLSEKKRAVFELCCWDDYSLSEAAEHTKTSRQAVRELLEHACAELESFERALGMVKTFSALEELCAKCERALAAVKENGTGGDLPELEKYIAEIRKLVSPGRRGGEI